MSSTVYICQASPEHNYASLERFGTIRKIATRSIYPDEAETRAKHLADWSLQQLAQFDPDVDFIALAGDPAIISIVTAIAMSRAFQRGRPYIRLLKWDRNEQAYYIIPFKFPLYIGGLRGKS